MSSPIVSQKELDSAVEQSYKEVTDDNNPINWVLFSCDTGELNVFAKGDQGYDDMIKSLEDGRVLFGYAAFKNPGDDKTRFVFITWVPSDASLKQRSQKLALQSTLYRVVKLIHLEQEGSTREALSSEAVAQKLSKSASKFQQTWSGLASPAKQEQRTVTSSQGSAAPGQVKVPSAFATLKKEAADSPPVSPVITAKKEHTTPEAPQLTVDHDDTYIRDLDLKDVPSTPSLLSADIMFTTPETRESRSVSLSGFTPIFNQTKAIESDDDAEDENAVVVEATPVENLTTTESQMKDPEETAPVVGALAELSQPEHFHLSPHKHTETATESNAVPPSAPSPSPSPPPQKSGVSFSEDTEKVASPQMQRQQTSGVPLHYSAGGVSFSPETSAKVSSPLQRQQTSGAPLHDLDSPSAVSFSPEVSHKSQSSPIQRQQTSGTPLGVSHNDAAQSVSFSPQAMKVSSPIARQQTSGGPLHVRPDDVDTDTDSDTDFIQPPKSPLTTEKRGADEEATVESGVVNSSEPSEMQPVDSLQSIETSDSSVTASNVKPVTFPDKSPVHTLADEYSQIFGDPDVDNDHAQLTQTESTHSIDTQDMIETPAGDQSERPPSRGVLVKEGSTRSDKKKVVSVVSPQSGPVVATVDQMMEKAQLVSSRRTTASRYDLTPVVGDEVESESENDDESQKSDQPSDAEEGEGSPVASSMTRSMTSAELRRDIEALRSQLTQKSAQLSETSNQDVVRQTPGALASFTRPGAEPQKRWLVDSIANMRAVLRLLRTTETPMGPQKTLSGQTTTETPTPGNMLASVLWLKVDMSGRRAIEQKTAWSALSDALGENTSLTNLVMSGNHLKVEGIEAISEALRTNTTLTALDLSNNPMKRPGCLAVADALLVNTTLLSLNMFGNRLSTPCAKLMANMLLVNKTLTSLFLKLNKLGDAGCALIGDALSVNKSLTVLDLGYNDMTDKACETLSHAVQVNKVLTYLDLQGNRITEEGYSLFSTALARNSVLVKIDMIGNPLSKRFVNTSNGRIMTTPLESIDLL